MFKKERREVVGEERREVETFRQSFVCMYLGLRIYLVMMC